MNEELKQQILERIDSPELWDTLIVNLKKPHTYRAFFYIGSQRICLHKFSACKEEESFYHPHPWACKIHILSGIYKMSVGHAETLDSKPSHVIDLELAEGSSYEMAERQTWHKVIPVTDCYSVMTNGFPWEEKHSSAPTTVGRKLDKFTKDELIAHLAVFKKLLRK